MLDTEQIVSLLMSMVRIDSESGREEEFIRYLKTLLEKAFNAECERDSFGNLVVRVPPLNSKRKIPVLFGVHADTVSPGRDIKPYLEDGVIRSRGDTILGSDDKAGIAELICALQQARRRPPVEILVTREEEVGLKGSKNADLTKLRARFGFVIDGSDLDTIVIGGPSHIMMDVAVQGRSAHAGMRPEQGISALEVVARAMTSLCLGRVDDESTCNVGTLRGGTARNAVPEMAFLEAECRSLNHEKCEGLARQMRSAFESAARYAGASVQISQELCYRASSLHESHDLVQYALAAVRSVGLVPKVASITGGTDALILTDRGIDAVVVGMGNNGAHTTEEHITTNSLKKGKAIVGHLLDSLAMCSPR